MNPVFHICEDGSETELRHCASLKISNVKSSQKYFVHLNWIRLATNRSDSIAQLVERRSRNPMMRFQFPLKTRKFSLISAVSFHICGYVHTVTFSHDFVLFHNPNLLPNNRKRCENVTVCT